jgi:hypothetical protein
MGKYNRETLSFTKKQTTLLFDIANHKNCSKAYIMRTAFDFWCANINPDWLPQNKGGE